ncbi:hypothetical protein [Salinicola tamaricis]|uniref:hypothetical protein n=1 Tax=Salinicola tamaricis TaxID=1771309 RepID=UPI001F5CAA54|nr:hypothetical protein [Salinicola tamaricis]
MTPPLIPLTHLAVLECRGADAARFLQGQTSANVEHANGTLAPLTVFCTPKGRCWPMPSCLRWHPSTRWCCTPRWSRRSSSNSTSTPPSTR